MSANVITNAEFLKAMQAAGIIADAEQVVSLTIHLNPESGCPIVWVELIGGPKLVEVVSLLAPSLTINDLSAPQRLVCPKCGNADSDRFMGVGGVDLGHLAMRCHVCGTDVPVPLATPGLAPPPEAFVAATLSVAEKHWTCPKCGSEHWVSASLSGPVGYGGKAIRQCVPCGYYDRNSSAS